MPPPVRTQESASEHRRRLEKIRSRLRENATSVKTTKKRKQTGAFKKMVASGHLKTGEKIFSMSWGHRLGVPFGTITADGKIFRESVGLYDSPTSFAEALLGTGSKTSGWRDLYVLRDGKRRTLDELYSEWEPAKPI